MILCIIAAVSGMSSDQGSVESMAWMNGKGSLCKSTTEGICHRFSVHISIVTRLDKIDCGGYADCISEATSRGLTTSDGNVFYLKRDWEDNQACGVSLETTQMCEECKETLFTSTTLLISIFTQLPTIATNLQRATLFGDVNCQNTMGKLSNIFSFVSQLMSLQAFRSACMMDLPDSLEGVKIEWSLGAGYRCLMAATIIKVIDLICHCLVPTPPERWQKPEKRIDDVVDYLMLAAPHTSKMSIEPDPQTVGQEAGP
jgi:hypothetical protein